MTKHTIWKEFSIEAAHWLPNVPDGHKCKRLHGHSFKVEVHVAGPLKEVGWVLDFADIKGAVQPLIEELDHHCLNDIPGLENPTSEMLAQWMWTRLRLSLPNLARIVVRETCTVGCEFVSD